MISYTFDKQNYAEIVGLSTDTKPEGIGAVPNGSKLTEIDTGKKYRFNGETGKWIEQNAKYPVKLEEVSGAYKVTYSDNSTKTEDVEVTVVGTKAYYEENGILVSCDAIEVTVAIVGDTETATYDGEAHTASGYTATPSKNTYSVANDMEYLGEETPSVSRTEVGKSMMGLTADDFKNLNDQFIVTFTVTDGYVEIEEAEEQPSDPVENADN